MSDAMLHGRFVWHELMTTDIKGAASFFTKIIGWKTEPWANDPTYTLFTKAGQPAAGLMLLPEDAKAMGVPPNWCTHIGTPNVPQTVKRAESLGARVHRPPTELPSVGTFAVLGDPQGAVFAVYSPEQDNTSDKPADVGEFSWHELATTDYKAALEFYRALFGWEDAGAQDMGGDLGIYQMFGRNSRPLGGIFTKPAQMPGPPFWLPYIRVKDARQVALAAQKAKGSIINGPMEVPGGDWIAQGMDLQGAVFAVHSITAPAAQSPTRKPAAAANKKKPASRKAATRKAATRKAARPAAAARKASRKKPAASSRKSKPAARKAASRPGSKKAVRKAAPRKRAKAPAGRKRSAKKASRR